MSNRRTDRNPAGPERRREYRREEDTETHAIVDTAGSSLKFIRSIRHRFVVMIIGALLGAAIAFPSAVLGARVVGPKQDIELANKEIAKNAARITAIEKSRDSLLITLSDIKREVSMATRLGCLNSAPKVAVAAGCP